MKHMITRKVVMFASVLAMGLSLLTTGCERTVSQTEETKVKDDGTVQTKEKKVTENPDGTVTKTEKKSEQKP